MTKPKPIEYIVQPNGCHHCISHRDKQSGGYPRISRKFDHQRETHMLLSRYLYMQKHGPIPSNTFIRHKCDNPLCINVDHLEPGSPKDNMEDREQRGRTFHGEGHPLGKLTKQQVLEIFTDTTRSTRRLAKDYGVSQCTVMRTAGERHEARV